MLRARKFPIGAEVLPEGGVDFRVWAPRASQVAVELWDGGQANRREVALEPEAGGYFSALVREAVAGMRYRFKLEHGSFPDPASRFQPDGPHGASEIVDAAFRWTDAAWRGRPAGELAIYELHLGTFTQEGTWRAAMAELPELARIGITMIEVMPVAEFPGEFGWGYDGVDLFAPTRLYGTPEDARAFVDRAHELGIAVILDVVYNHVGPDGNFLREFAADYFTTRYPNEWGEPLNFDGANSAPVRELFVTNARYWIEEFHLDGLRLDATQQIFDASPVHLLAEIGAAAREAGRDRTIHLIAENESQHAQLLRPKTVGGYGLDLIWNDDFHHAAMVSATGKAEAYYRDYRGSAQEFVSAAKRGFLFQGQWHHWQNHRRGRPAFDVSPRSFVQFLQNHDQIANSLRGLRLHELTSAGKLRALTALLLLTPQVPMLFQGQEFAASAPFLYFADHRGELRDQVREGRAKFLRQFATIAREECAGLLADPGDRGTFERCKLDLIERATHEAIYRLHEDLLRLRREDRSLGGSAVLDGAVLSEHAFVLRFFAPDGDDRLLIVNLGRDLWFGPAPEPLLAPLEGRGWRAAWSSDSPDYGGCGTPPLETTANWIIPGEAAVLLAPDENDKLPTAKVSEKN